MTTRHSRPSTSDSRSADPPDAFVSAVRAVVADPDDTEAMVTILGFGDAAIDWLNEHRVAPPPGVDFRDFGDAVSVVLGKVAAVRPRRLAALLRTPTHWGRRWGQVTAALVSGDPELLDLVIDVLDERSPHIKDYVLEAIANDERLHTAKAVVKLRKLLTLKIADDLSLRREEIAILAALIEARTQDQAQRRSH